MSATTVIAGGTVIDGRRGEPHQADVVIQGDRIAHVGVVSPGDRRGDDVRVVDAGGLVVAPGFIDAHSHADFTLPRHPAGDALVGQGCTTVVTGNCGFSPFPFAHGPTADARAHGNFLDSEHDRRWRSLPEFAASFGSTGVGVNVAALCGHGAVRTGVIGAVDRPATTAEREAIEGVTAAALDDGAFGVSLGLSYPHGRYADRAELAAIARAVAARGAVLTVHLRDEGAGLLDAVVEMTSLAAATGCSLQLSHHKAAGIAQHGLVHRSLGLVDDARARGIDVAIDAYPYTMGATTLAAALPDWSTGNGETELRRLAADDAARSRMVAELRAGHTRFDLSEIWISETSPRWHDLAGGMLVERATSRGADPATLLVDVIADDGMAASMMVFCMAPDDVHTVLRHPATLVGSDGWVLVPQRGTHPRNFQTFPQLLEGRFRERVGLGLAEVVARMTGDVAARFGLTGRGVVAPGCAADVVVLDPAAVAPGGDLDNPGARPSGIEHVFVNGAQVTATDGPRRLDGRVLRRHHQPGGSR